MQRKVKVVRVGNCNLGEGTVFVQSMLSCPAQNIEGNVAQASALEQAGCEIVRVAVPNLEAVSLVSAIKQQITIPLVADIHFDYRIALACVDVGVDKIRINPGNIGEQDRIKKVADACRIKGIPIRIGVNAGSLEKHILQRHGAPTPQALLESALYHVRLLEQFDFDDLVISIKSSNVKTMVRSYELLADACHYPLHLGVTEAGTERMGLVKSAVGIGSLLLRGIGETIRVSLTADPILEIAAAKDILKAVGIRNQGVEIISCPTCGRTQIDLIPLVNQIEKALQDCKKTLKVAVMGCAVNGPGEAKEADIGIAGGDGSAVLFKKGRIIRKIDESDIIQTLLSEIEKM